MTTTGAYHPETLGAWWESRQQADNIQWTRISAEVGEWLRGMIGRDDLLAVVEPGTGAGHPAVYIPEMAHVEVNPDVCCPGVDPNDIHMDTEVGRLKHAAFSGAGAHEGGHGAFSQWAIDQDAEKRAVVRAALGLEESRMEQHLVRLRPETRVLLRATFDKLVRSDQPIETPWAAAQTLVLTDARADAGILDHAEIQPVVDICVALLGQERYEALREIWREALALPEHDDKEAMEALGRRWLDVMAEDAEDEEGPIIFICGIDHDGDGEDGEGGGTMGAVAEAISAAAEKEAGEEAGAAEARDAAKAAKDAAKETEKNERAAEKVFTGKIVFIGHGYGYGAEGLSGARPPRPQEYGQANILANRLQQAQYRERTEEIVPSAIPPGRLRSSVALKRSAERANGQISTARPWRHRVHHYVEEPPVTVAVGCDISGSMSQAAEAVASTAWILSHAVRRIDGTSATVAFGERVHAVVKPGEAPNEVREFEASGGMENIVGALRAFDGALNLENGEGVRLVAIISDGHWTSGQRAEGDKLAKRLVAAGVKIIHMGFEGPRRDIPLAGSTYVRIGDPAQIGRTIGDAMVALLEGNGR